MLGTKGGGGAVRRRRINDLLALGALIVYTAFALFPVFFEQIQWGSMAAGVMLAIVPEFFIAIFALRYMIRGLTAGTVKG